MIRINLIPFRKARKIENIQRQVTVFMIIFAIIMGGMLYYNMTLTNEIEALDTKIKGIKTQIAKVEKRAKEVDKLRKALAKLNHKIKIINDLEAKRQEAVRLLDNMTTMVTENAGLDPGTIEDQDQKPYKRLWFTSFQARGNNINIKGVALDNRTVADFMTRLETSKLFTNINLNTLKKNAIKNLNLKSFHISCSKASKQKDKK